MFDVIAVGAGEVFEKYWLPAIQKSEKVRLICIVEPRGMRIAQLMCVPSFRNVRGAASFGEIPDDVSREAIILVLTPDHFPVVQELAEVGFKNIVIEKPLVSRDHELPLILELAKQRNLKLYAVDMYLPKAFSLAAILGAVSGDDPRFAFLSSSGSNFAPVSAHLGDVEGISVSIIEGGDLGLPSLDRRQWLEKDPEVGGMLRDLGTHAFGPLVNAGLLDTGAEVCSATLAKLTQDRLGLTPVTTRKDVEMYVSAQLANGGIPVHVVLGKLPQKGGEWSLSIRGSKGMFFSSLRSGQPAVVLGNDGTVIPLWLTVSPLEFILEEISLFYEGHLPAFDGNIGVISASLHLNEKVRDAYFSSL